jgi:hypothetical protein
MAGNDSESGDYPAGWTAIEGKDVTGLDRRFGRGETIPSVP